MEETIKAIEAYPVIKAFAQGKLQVEHYDQAHLSCNGIALLVRTFRGYRFTVHLQNESGQVRVTRIPSVTTPSGKIYNVNLDNSTNKCPYQMLPPKGKRAFDKRLVEMKKEAPELQVEVHETYKVFFRGSAVNGLYDDGPIWVTKNGAKVAVKFPDRLRNNSFDTKKEAQFAAEKFKEYFKARARERENATNKKRSRKSR